MYTSVRMKHQIIRPVNCHASGFEVASDMTKVVKSDVTASSGSHSASLPHQRKLKHCTRMWNRPTLEYSFDLSYRDTLL